jgi:hypothetical protein
VLLTPGSLLTLDTVYHRPSGLHHEFFDIREMLHLLRHVPFQIWKTSYAKRLALP